MTVNELLARRREKRRRELGQVVDELSSAVVAVEACASILEEQGGWPMQVGMLRSYVLALRGVASSVKEMSE